MPRDGSGNFTLPANTQAVSGDPISSTKFNTLVQDLEADANVDRPVAAGGTGASTALAARANLGLEIGTDVQAYDAGLLSIAGLTTTADRGIYTTASDTYAVYTLTAAGRAILDDADASAQRTTLGLGSLATLSTINNDNWSGTDLAVANGGTGASDASTALTNLGALAASAYTASDVLSKLLTVDGAGTGLDADLLDGVQPSAFGLTIIDDADASAARTTLGLANGATTTISAFALTMLDDADASAVRTTLGLGTAALKNTGTSGDAVPLLNAANTFSDTVTATRFQVGTFIMDDNIGLGADIPGFNLDSNDWLVYYRASNRLEVGIGAVNAFSVTGSGATILGNTVWHAGNDGTGSGLDADTVDGAHVGTSGATIPLLNGANTFSGGQTFTSGSNSIASGAGAFPGFELRNSADAAFSLFMGFDTSARNFFINRWNPATGAYVAAGLVVGQDGTFSWAGNTIWHAGNDGAGSGLDADTLDGVQGSAYAALAGTQTFTGAKTFSPGDTETVFNRSADTPFIQQFQTAGTTRGYVGFDSTNFQVWNAGLSQNVTFNLSTGLLTCTGSIAIRANASAETSGTLTSASANKTIQATGDITIPNAVFAAGDIILIYAGASARTITQGASVTMRLGGTATTGSRTLAARGVAMLFFVSSSEVIVSGGAVT